MEVLIEGMNHTGEGIGRIDGKIVFVPKTVIGDVVKLKNVVDYKKFYKADIEVLVTKSSDRCNFKCKYFNECGGCQLMNYSYLNQLKYKQDKFKNIMKKYGDIEISSDIILSDKIYGYRNKITLQVVDGKIGLFKYNSNSLVEIDKCLLVSDNVNNMISLISKKIDLTYVNNIMIREYNNDLMVQFNGRVNEGKVIDSISLVAKSIYVNDKLVFGSDSLEVKLGNYKYKVSPYSFFQVNYNQAERLYDKVKEYLGNNNKNVLDLYCGTGSIGIYVSSCCDEVIGIEINESSVKDALVNIKINNVDNVKVIQGDVGKILKDKGKYDAIIVDPPRSGLDKRTKDILLKLKSKKIIYVSCDPITLARDLKVLSDSYDIVDVSLVDMFPNTYHVESVVLLEFNDVNR